MPPLTPSEGINWLKGLGKRPYKDMPPQMRPVWLLTRVIGLLVVIAGLVLALIFARHPSLRSERRSAGASLLAEFRTEPTGAACRRCLRVDPMEQPLLSRHVGLPR
jgi:hypothetical protein